MINLNQKPKLCALYPFSATPFQLFPGTAMRDLQLPHPAQIIAFIERTPLQKSKMKHQDGQKKENTGLQRAVSNVGAHECGAVNQEVISLLSDDEYDSKDAQDLGSLHGAQPLHPRGNQEKGGQEIAFASDVKVHQIGRLPPSMVTSQIDNKNGYQRRKRRRILKPPGSGWSHLCHPLLGRLVKIPESILNECERPEDTVYIQQGCMEDFTYSATLMIPNKWKYTCALRVLQEGAQCKVFAGTFGFPKEKGRGVIALEAIEKGKCILEYTGKLLDQQAADKTQGMYNFDISPHQNDEEYKDLITYRVNGLLPTVISANHYGNVARLINHSCCPNLEVVKDPELVREVFGGHGIYHVVLQTIRQIWPGEELNIDYHPEESRSTLVSWKENKIKCACGGGVYCKVWLPI